jgi:CYTH domain-containing protein
MASFVEFEHKFLVSRDFDVAAFARRVAALGPVAQSRADVRDTYWRVVGVERHIFRHRLEGGKQQLTVKDYDSGNEARLEVNLDLAGGDQLAAVDRFLAVFGEARRFTVRKDAHVFDFADCQIVHYTAVSGERRVDCVELEATAAATQEEARATLARFEAALGFRASERCTINLFDLIVRPS